MSKPEQEAPRRERRAPGPQFDAKVYDELIEKERLDQRSLNDRIRELRNRMDDMRGGLDVSRGKREELLTKIREISQQLMEIDKKRGLINNEIALKEEERMKLVRKAQAMRKDLLYLNEDDITRKMSELESALNARSMNLNEERALLAEIKALKQNKVLIGSFTAANQAAAGHDASHIAPLRAEYEGTRAAYTELVKQKQELQATLAQLIKEQNVNSRPVREIYDQIALLRKEHAEHGKRIAEVTAERNAAKEKWQKHQDQVAAEKAQKRMAESARREREQKREALKAEIEDLDEPEEPLVMQKVSQCLLYIETILANHDGNPSDKGLSDKQDQSSESTSAAKMSDLDAEGEILVPKNQRDDVYYVAPTRTSKNKKKHKTQKPSTLTHDLKTMAVFDQIGVSVPLNIEQCKECHSSLKSRRDAWEEKWKDERAKLVERRRRLMEQLEALERDENESPISVPKAAAEVAAV